MRTTWKGLLLMLMVAEALLVVLFMMIKPQCEPCPPSGPCPPCISSAQERVLLTACLLPPGVLLQQFVSWSGKCRSLGSRQQVRKPNR